MVNSEKKNSTNLLNRMLYLRLEEPSYLVLYVLRPSRRSLTNDLSVICSICYVQVDGTGKYVVQGSGASFPNELYQAVVRVR